MRLLPREEKFYHFFLDQAGIILKASELLLNGARAGNARLVDAAAEIVKLEQKGDEIIHEVFVRLNQTFITPLDPEDIHTLCSNMDDVLDGIEDAAHRMLTYRIEPIPPAVIELCEIINGCAKELVPAFRELERNGEVLKHCIELNRLEDTADQIVRRAVAELFANQTDAIMVIKLKEIYDFLEETTDRCEDVADTLQNVIVKNS
ncbi:MAG: DUF47 family protein [Bryobacteraceae bacterium]|nr:DUF47 family protein [Bryobacteraceae bacterium]